MFASPGKRFEYLCIDQFHVFIVACVYCILVYFEVTATCSLCNVGNFFVVMSYYIADGIF